MSYRFESRQVRKSQVIVASRDAAEGYSPPAGAVVVSIRSPRLAPARLPEGFSSTLPVAFDDVTGPTPNCLAVNGVAADRIASFLIANKDAPAILLHCEQGKSRSSAIKLAYLDALGETTREDEETEKEHNPFVRLHVKQALLRKKHLLG